MAKTKKKKTLFIILGVVLFIVALCFYIKWKLPIERTNYKSFAQFKESGALAYIDIPEGATDERYYHTNMVLWKQTAYSFVLSDDEAYDAFMEEMKDIICNEQFCENPAWSQHWKGPKHEYTEEELEEMEYLQENYMDMDYKEILSMSRHKYGFAAGYGAPVSDYLDIYLYSYSDGWEYKEVYEDIFPVNAGIEYVIDDDMAEYTILGFASSSATSSPKGIIVNEETRRFVIFYNASI